MALKILKRTVPHAMPVCWIAPISNPVQASPYTLSIALLCTEVLALR